MTEPTEEKRKHFDPFELAVSILLGLAAIGAAWSSFQSSMWGGIGLEAYSESATMATKASIEQTRAGMDVAHDNECDLQAKAHILEAYWGTNGADRPRLLHMASYLYAVEMSATGYAALKLPPSAYTSGDIGKFQEIPPDALQAVLNRRLDRDYEDKMFAKSKSDGESADRRFDEGRQASNHGDHFDLDTVVFTVSLFFAGLGLVFKTEVRWWFLIAGVLVFSVATVYMMISPWA